MVSGNKIRLDIGISNVVEEKSNPPTHAVVKLGGSVLRDSDSYTKAAELIKNLQKTYINVVVVVSARKGRTNELIGEAESLKLVGLERERFLMSGEMDSAKKLAEVLDCNSYIQEEESFPLSCVNNNPLPYNEDSCEKVAPLCNAGISVVAGFGGRDRAGNPRIYGRGGSDTLAAQAASWISAHSKKGVDLFYIKDVGGIIKPGVDLDGLSQNQLRENYIESIPLVELNGLLKSGQIKQVLHEKIFDVLENMNHGSRVLVADNYGNIGTEIRLT